MPPGKPLKWPTPLPTVRLSREFLGIFFVTLAMLILLSLWSFSIQDLGWFESRDGATPGTRDSPHNWIGLVGAVVAASLIWFTGSASLTIPFLILLHGVRIFQNAHWVRQVSSVAGSVLFVLCTSALIHVHHPSSIQALQEGITAGLYAGKGGGWIAGGAEFLFARLGSTVVLVALLLTALLLVVPFSLSAEVGRIPRGVGKGVGTMGKLARFPTWHWPSWSWERRKPKPNKPVHVSRRPVASHGSFFDFTDKGDPVQEPPARDESAVPADVESPEETPLPWSAPVQSEEVQPEEVQPEAVEPDVEQPVAVRKVSEGYHFPDPLALLEPPPVSDTQQTEQILASQSRILLNTLQSFGITGEVTEVHPGPVITMYEFVPGPGIKIARIVTLAHDLAMVLKSTSVRIVAPIPGKSSVGIEVPNPIRETVALREILSSEVYTHSRSKLTLALGKDIVGRPYVADLKTMPHLLVAGATGAGKSVGLNSMLLSLLFSAHPDEVKLLLIDPKVLELQVYDSVPHLLRPVLTNPQTAARGLTWVVQEMERRYNLLAEHGVRNIHAYNVKISQEQAGSERTSREPKASAVEPSSEDADSLVDAPPAPPEPLPYIVVVVDEFADLMMMAPKEVEGKIARLAQMARASGIHLILATQRPSVDVVTGLIKANFPARIAYQVASKTDSRTILDANGAESLLGLGDMLYLAPGTGRLVRLHGSYVSDDDVRCVVEHVKTQASPAFCDDAAFEDPAGQDDEQERDDVYEHARDVVLNSGQASASLVQRRVRVGYPRAARMIERMEKEGLVSAPGRDGRREVLGRRMALEEEVG